MPAPSTRIFEPITIGSLTVSGRLFKTASAETRASPDGFVTDELLQFYAPIAEAGTPLIITGNIYVSENARQSARMIGADHDDKISGLKRLTSLVHACNSRIFAQLNHCGRQVLTSEMRSAKPVSASDVVEKTLCTKPTPLTQAEIDDIVESFAAAAKRCAQAGFDGVQIHAAHGYLVNQFLTPYTNRRTDKYGGSFDNRLRLLVEIYRAIRARVGEAYPIIVKLNGEDALFLRKGLSASELVNVAQAMETEGIDGVEISIGHYESGFGFIRGRFQRFFSGLMKEGVGEQLPFPQRAMFTWLRPVAALVCNLLWRHHEGFNLRLAKRFTASLSIPVICVGGFQTAKAMNRAIDDRLCDAVSSARAIIADPYLYKHLREGTQGPLCVFCNACIARAGRMPLDCYHPEVRKQKDDMLSGTQRITPPRAAATTASRRPAPSSRVVPARPESR